MLIRRLSPTDTSLLLESFIKTPHESVAIRGMVNYGNLSMFPWIGGFHSNELNAVGVLIPGQLALIWASQNVDCSEIGQAFREFGSPCTAIGPQQAVKTLWSGWSNEIPLMTEQTLYVATNCPKVDSCSGFRLAEERDAAVVAQYAGSGEEEETGRNTFREHPNRLLKLVETRIAKGHTWVIEQEGHIKMQVHIAPVLPDVCQLVGTYVPPPYRGQGFSTKGVNGLLQSMIPTGRDVVLRVDNDNIPAIRCYESNGFSATTPFSVLNSPE